MLDLFIGGISGILSRTIVAPLELYKIQRQNSFIPNTTFKDVINKEGVRYLWKGNGTNCVRIFPQYAINYYVFNSSKKYLFSSSKYSNLLSGGMGGVMSMMCCYPLETIRSRIALQTNHSHYKGIFDVVKKMKFKELYMGCQTSLIGYGFYSAFNYYFYFYYKNYFNDVLSNSTFKHLVCGSLTGISSISLTYPTDVVRRRLQLQGFHKNVPKYNGLIHCCKKMFVDEGIRGFYKGLGACYMKIIPATAFQWFFIEKFKKILL